VKGIRPFLALLVLVLMAAACGTSPDDAAAPQVSDGLPLAPEGMEDTSGDQPLYVEGEPREGLTLDQALATDATGILEVRAFVFVDEAGPRLCSVMAASLPPLCGGDTIALANLDAVDASWLEQADGIQWTNEYVTLFGEIIDGQFVVDPLTTG